MTTIDILFWMIQLLGALPRFVRFAGSTLEMVHEMIDEGVLIPEGTSPETWRFNALAIKRIQITLRLQNDLRVNLPGAALALDLLEELDELRALLRQVS